ncbi:MAG: tetratricopeptide repeat protein [Gemmatimonadales bacterium]|nr:tetratricopeptide repeat protein [Gemmatimonadales bacterium]
MKRFAVIVLFLLGFTALNSPLPTYCGTAEPFAAVDSAMVATFLELPGKTIQDRRQQAEQLLEQARKEKSGPIRSSLLEEATFFDPAGTANWLALAELQLLMGYDPEAEASLEAAWVTIGFLTGKEREEAIRSFSLAKSWWYYQMGSWKKGIDWGRRAVEYDAGLYGHLALLLNSALFLDSGKELYRELKVFLSSTGDMRPIVYKDWCRTMYKYFHKVESDIWVASGIYFTLAKKFGQETLRWSDYGMYCALNGDGDLAIRFYEKSFADLPVPEGGWIRRLERTVPVLKVEMDPMPFWVNPEDRYVTGSLLAYLGHVRDCMVATKDPAEKDLLAERVLAYSSRTSNRYPFHPWPVLWRAEALLELDQLKEARAEIRYAEEMLIEEKLKDPKVNRVFGRILLMQKKYGKSAQRLRQAVVDFSHDATCWADLGVAETAVGDSATARQAFDQALTLNAELAAAWYNRGLLLKKTGDLQSAQADMERALQLMPDNCRIQEDLIRLNEMVVQQRLGG